jgi:hypothetical protein
MSKITITLTVEELLSLPGEAVIKITHKAEPSLIFLSACVDHENRALHGKGRWPVNNHLRQLIAKQPHIGCAVCDLGDHQLGHAEGCPKA